MTGHFVSEDRIMVQWFGFWWPDDEEEDCDYAAMGCGPRYSGIDYSAENSPEKGGKPGGKPG